MNSEDIIKILVSLLMGSVIGLEREYRNKPAGFRTLTLICVGSTLFTIMSLKIGGLTNGDRIASYILVGVGFIGSGVIFKEGLKIAGLTTAATIWITSALGMAIGNGDFLLAAIVLLVTYTVLEVLSRIDLLMSRFKASKIFIISFKSDGEVLQRLETEFRRICPKVKRTALRKSGNKLTGIYKVDGGIEKFNALQQYLLANEEVMDFES